MVVRPSSRRANPDLALTVLVFLGLFAWFWAIQRGEFVSYDGRIMAGVARNLWEHGSLRPVGDSFGTGLHLHWAPYGIAMSLLMAPLWALQLDRDPHGAFWLTFVGPILTALTGALLYRIGRTLGWRRTTAVIVPVAFGILTMAAVYSTELFSEPAVTLGTVIVVLGLLRWRDDATIGPWLVGGGIAFTILARFDSVVLVLPVLIVVPLFVPLTRLRATWRRWVPALAIPLALALGWTLYYNNLRFGSPFDAGYQDDLFTFGFFDGIGRQLLSPGKGFFWYDAILIAALPGFVLLWRRDRGTAVAVAGLSLARVLFFASWYTPDGFVAWGPRFLLPACALLAIPLGETIEWVHGRDTVARRVAFGVIGGLALVSAVVTVVSLWLPYDYSWTVVNAIPHYQELPVATVDRLRVERLDAMNNTWEHSPINLGLRSLAHPRAGTPFPLRWWRGGPSPTGVLAVLLAGGCLGLAGLVAHKARGGGAERTPTTKQSIG